MFQSPSTNSRSFVTGVVTSESSSAAQTSYSCSTSIFNGTTKVDSLRADDFNNQVMLRDSLISSHPSKAVVDNSTPPKKSLPRRFNGLSSVPDSVLDNFSQTSPACHFGLHIAEQQILDEFFKRTRPPAQQEWETLWYHAAAGSFKKVAHRFPDINLLAGTAPESPGISEPTLELSSLQRDERAVFAKDEPEKKSTFIPKTSEERLQRERRARSARNESERFALLLGLPTYEEYLVTNIQKQRTTCQDTSFGPSKRQTKKQARLARDKGRRASAKARCTGKVDGEDEGYFSTSQEPVRYLELIQRSCKAGSRVSKAGMSSEGFQSVSHGHKLSGAEHRPLVVGLTKPKPSNQTTSMASSGEAAALNKEIEENVKSNTLEAAPSEDNPTAPSSVRAEQKKEKKEKAPKPPKPPKGGAAPPAPTTPALIDLRVGHILRAIAHPNADSLYVSTIAMGDPEGTEHTQVDEETGKIVRTVCSGLNGLVPLEEMQNRKIIVVANLKPVNMRSIKSAAMVLAASPKQEEGADPHAPDRVVELVQPPEGAEAGDKVFFEGWPYGEGKGPEKQLNPKKKQWEAVQPGFYTADDLTVGFDASKCEEVEGEKKGNLVVEGKGVCTVKTLKGAVVR